VAAFWAVNASACVPPIRFGPERQESPWLTYLGSPRHDVSAAESLSADPRPQWRTGTGRAVRGAPALGENVVAVGTVERTVVLLNRESGELLWRSRLGGTIHGGPLLDEDRLYVATEAAPDGRVYALRLRTGKPIWVAKTGGIEAPLALDGTAEALYAGSEAGVAMRLDPETGRILWRRRLAGAIRAAPIPTDRGLAVATDADTLYLLDSRTGDVLAQLATGAVLGTPAAAGDHLYLGTMAGHVLAVELPALRVLWDQDVGDAVYGAPALAQDTLYVLTRNGTLWVMPAARSQGAAGGEAGPTRIALDIVATAGPTPVAAGVLVASVGGEILLVRRGDGTIRWRARVDGPVEEPPLVRDRQLVVVGGRGDIQAFR
jgi:outer membrane protein assembly factor BamB